MQNAIFRSSSKGAPYFAIALIALTLAALPLSAQDASSSAKKPTPTKIESPLIVVGEPVVLVQWPHTLNLVNAPANVSQLNPGQCVRVGVYATGDDRDSYIKKTRISFRVEFARQSQDHALTALAQFKQIKPEGGDLVTAALGAAGIKNPLLTMATVGVSADDWCVPAEAQDGEAVIEADVESPGGRQKQSRAKIQIESMETGSKRSFKDDQEFSAFLMSYHVQPNPARLYPALLYFTADRKGLERNGALETISSSLSAGLKDNPVAAKDFMARVETQSGATRYVGALALFMAGYDIEPVLKTMSEETQQTFKHLAVPDPYDFSVTQNVPTEFDMLWGIFSMSGQYAPMQKIASALAWRADWDDLAKARKSSNPPKQWTPSIGRAVAYAAAGWSLSSFQRNDPLAADYIETMLASPDTSETVKSELKGLLTNPAFKGGSQ
jgi:hypothetical protein